MTAAGFYLLTHRPANGDHPPAPPPVVTCRGLLAEPGYYAGRRVRLNTVGMEPGLVPTELVYRRWAGLPPSVVCVSDHPFPSPLPAFVTGRVEVGGKGPIALTGCRPE